MGRAASKHYYVNPEKGLISRQPNRFPGLIKVEDTWQDYTMMELHDASAYSVRYIIYSGTRTLFCRRRLRLDRRPDELTLYNQDCISVGYNAYQCDVPTMTPDNRRSEMLSALWESFASRGCHRAQPSPGWYGQQYWSHPYRGSVTTYSANGDVDVLDCKTEVRLEVANGRGVGLIF